MKISIITPSFNQGNYIEKTIDSVLSQKYPDLEYIIIDGGSTDNSVEVIKKYEKYLTYWVSEKDKGQSHAINKGLKLATGEVVNWINSDDWYYPDTLHKVASAFEDENILVVSGKGSVWQDNRIRNTNPGADIYPEFEKTVGWARIDQPETFFRHSAIKKMGLLNTDLHYVMDREWWIRFLLHFGQDRVKKVEDLLVNFRLHEDSKSYNFQNLFSEEALNVYYSIARQNNLKEEFCMLESEFKVAYIDSLQYNQIADMTLLKKIIHYFLFLEGRLKYADNELALAARFLKLVDKRMLQAKDRSELRQLKIRTALMPAWLKKIVNKR